MNNMLRFGSLAVALVVAACAQQPAAPPDTRAADEAAVRAAIKEWAAAAQAKDAAKFVSFYTEDAVVMLEDSPDITGMAAIREALTGMMQDPNFSLSFAPDRVEVSRSGDLAYETGPFTMIMSGPDGKPATEKGHYVAVWRKQAGGAWKVAVDAPLSDPPEGATAPTSH